MRELRAPARPARVELELPPDRSFHAVGRLVAAGVGSRAGLGVDRIDDLQLALVAVLRRPDARGSTRMALTASPDDLHVEIGPLRARDSGCELERVVSAFVPDVETHGVHDQVWISFRLPTHVSAESR